jgi:DNA excision repair protein ERCC-2
VAIFFTSYPMMNNYRDVCLTSSKKVGKKLCIEPRSADEVPELLEEFFALGHSRGAVLMGVCGGKLAEGIDYKGEALNGVAIVGLPLAAYDEIQKEINGYYAKKYGKAKGMLIAYTLPAMNRGLQAAGRVIRSESERGVLLFCDRRFGDDSLGGVNQFLPDWVRSELILVDSKQARKIISEKIVQWKTKIPEMAASSVNSPTPKRNKTLKSGKRDLRELAKSLGLGEPRQQNTASKVTGDIKNKNSRVGQK